MKTNVRETSIQAHAELVGSGKKKTKKQMVKDFVDQHPEGVTRFEVAKHFDWQCSTISGLVKPLVDDNEISESARKTQCPVTGNLAYKLLPFSGQVEMKI